jgi:tRNA threonylcarbamoyladenosine biosynthesis protein TsaB
VLAVLDARRGEAFAAAWQGEERLLAPVAVTPDRLAGLASGGTGDWLVVGDGAIRFRASLEPGGLTVPADGSALHRVSAITICRLAMQGVPVDRDALTPEYVREPDAVPRPARSPQP